MSFNFMAAITICSDFGAPNIKSDTVSTVSPSISYEVMDIVPFHCAYTAMSEWLTRAPQEAASPGGQCLQKFLLPFTLQIPLLSNIT